MPTPFEQAWVFIKQYDPQMFSNKLPHSRSVMFPQMRSPTETVVNRQLGRDGYPLHTPEEMMNRGYFIPYHEQDREGPLHEERFQHQRKGRNLTPDEQLIRVTADRNEAIDRANQYHQERIDAMQNLSEPSSSSQPSGPVFNPFQNSAE